MECAWSVKHVGQDTRIVNPVELLFRNGIERRLCIANQLNSLLSTLSQTLLKSFAPQIVKNMGAGNRERTVALTMINCKLSLVFVVLISVPLLLELPYILKLWLGEIPEHTIVFSQLFVLLAYFNQISYGLMNIIQSQGRIRNYMLSVSGLMFLIIPITACLYLYGCPPYTVLVVSIVIEMITACVRIRFAKTLVGFPQKRYFNEVVFPSLGIFCLLFLVGWLLHYCLNEGFVRLLLVTLLSGGLNVILSYFLICSKKEKEKILSRIKK